jgi:hypothetical protein
LGSGTGVLALSSALVSGGDGELAQAPSSSNMLNATLLRMHESTMALACPDL